jgi:hypothetical protein
MVDTVGFYVKNTVDNSYQIDQTYKNLTYKGKGTFSATDSVVPVEISVTGVNPIVGVRSTGSFSPVLIHSAQNTGGTAWTYRFWSKAGDTVTYYVFDEPTATSPQYGYIKNSAGQVVFNFAEEYFTPVGEYSFTWTTGNGNQHTNLTAGRTFAAVNIGGNYGISATPLNPGQVAVAEFGVGAYFDGTGLILEGKPIFSTQAVSSPGNFPAQGKYLVIDVTGL